MSLSDGQEDYGPLFDLRPERFLNGRIQASQLINILRAHISPMYLTPLLLLTEGESYQEIGDTLRISVKAVKSRIHRARAAAARALVQQGVISASELGALTGSTPRKR